MGQELFHGIGALLLLPALIYGVLPDALESSGISVPR
jgi:hypothetical protein